MSQRAFLRCPCEIIVENGSRGSIVWVVRVVLQHRRGLIPPDPAALAAQRTPIGPEPAPWPGLTGRRPAALWLMI